MNFSRFDNHFRQIVYQLISNIFQIYSHIVLEILVWGQVGVMGVAAVCACAPFLAMLDRTIASRLMRQVDFWFLMLQAVQFTVANAWQESVQYRARCVDGSFCSRLPRSAIGLIQCVHI